MSDSLSHRLDQQSIVTAALAIADAEGITAVTLRRVAIDLSAGTMSLYRHIDGKDKLMNLLIERIVAEIPLSETGTDWRTGLQARATATRQACLAHPWAARLMESRMAPGPMRLTMQENGLALLTGDGFPLGLACRALIVLDSYVYGFSLRETALPAADQLPDAVRDIAPAVRPEDYPNIVAAMMQAMAEAGQPGGAARLIEADFFFGLDMLLDGLARTLGDFVSEEGLHNEHDQTDT